MTKEFNIEDAADWSDEEAAEILAWLRDRPWRYDEVNQILAARGEEPTGESDGGAQAAPDLMEHTKAELLDMADEKGVEANDSMTKAEIIEALG
jgi:hypothetical protein